MADNTLPHSHGQGHIEEKLNKKLQNTEAYQSVAELFSLMADTSRVRIFWLLCHCEECVINISAMMEMTSPAVSHHLRLLREAELIESRRDGREVYYKAADTKQSRLLHQTIESSMKISCPKDGGESVETLQNGREETVRALHDYLLENMERRITIEELSKKFLMNPTTLKAAFKKIYGTSLASHIKEHRMERAAQLLRETEGSVAQIAAAVGFESQSKFSAAFKEKYNMLPPEYRKGQGK